MNNKMLDATRKEMTQEESQWLELFEKSFENKDFKSLEKLAVQGDWALDVLVRAKQEADQEWEARRYDVHTKFKKMSLEGLRTSTEGNVDPSGKRKQFKTKHGENYTAYDYLKPAFPNVDALIDLIDATNNKKGA